jgi:S1-C subfamily serine protease
MGGAGRRTGGESRSVIVLMASTFAAAVLVVAVVAVLTGALSGPTRSDAGVVARGPVVSRVDSEIVDIDTILDDGSGAAAGTGMVLTPSGLVLTNNHVIEQATSIEAVDVGNGQTYTAQVVGYDEQRDIAVLQLEGATGLQTVRLGNSASVAVNGRVVTIGNAGGLGGTPSARSGTVLALDRAINVANEFDHSSEHLTQLIQIHGDLQPGDSGGPLISASGTVVGMDTAASTSFQFAGETARQGFAIEIDVVKRIAAQIRSGRASGSIHIGPTAFIGVEVAAGSGGHPGAHVEGAIPDTPAAGAGLAAGDVITAVGGHTVTSATGLTEALVGFAPGARVPLTWLSPTGASQTATITLGTGPAA